MNELERQGVILSALQHRLESLEGRVELIETGRRRRGRLEKKAREAADLAAALGLPKSVFADARLVSERRRLAGVLKTENKWTARDIAAVLGCTERTVEREFQRPDQK